MRVTRVYEKNKIKKFHLLLQSIIDSKINELVNTNTKVNTATSQRNLRKVDNK